MSKSKDEADEVKDEKKKKKEKNVIPTKVCDIFLMDYGCDLNHLS